MPEQKGPLFIRIDIDPAFRRALSDAPGTVDERIHGALDEGMTILGWSVQQAIFESGRVRSGKMVRSVKTSVTKSARGDWTGRLRVRRFYGRFQNAGISFVATKFIRFPVGQLVEVNQIGDKQLKRSRYELTGAQWVTLKPGTVVSVPGSKFFDQGVDDEEQRVLDLFWTALDQAMRQEFGR
jgi:hypothetical protein